MPVRQHHRVPIVPGLTSRPPCDPLKVVARERQVDVDVAGAEQLLEQQRERARKAWTGSGGVPPPPGVV